jgi:hypothetical protein
VEGKKLQSVLIRESRKFDFIKLSYFVSLLQLVSNPSDFKEVFLAKEL